VDTCPRQLLEIHLVQIETRIRYHLPGTSKQAYVFC